MVFHVCTGGRVGCGVVACGVWVAAGHSCSVRRSALQRRAVVPQVLAEIQSCGRHNQGFHEVPPTVAGSLDSEKVSRISFRVGAVLMSVLCRFSSQRFPHRCARFCDDDKKRAQRWGKLAIFKYHTVAGFLKNISWLQSFFFSVTQRDI